MRGFALTVSFFALFAATSANACKGPYYWTFDHRADNGSTPVLVLPTSQLGKANVRTKHSLTDLGYFYVRSLPDKTYTATSCAKLYWADGYGPGHSVDAAVWTDGGPIRDRSDLVRVLGGIGRILIAFRREHPKESFVNLNYEPNTPLRVHREKKIADNPLMHPYYWYEGDLRTAR